MIEVHEIIIHTSAKNQVIVHLNKFQAGSRSTFVSGVLFYDAARQEFGPVKEFSFVHSSSAREVFEKVLQATFTALSNRGEMISILSNPCNAPFVSVEDQKDLLNKIGAAHATIKVNDKIVG